MQATNNVIAFPGPRSRASANLRKQSLIEKLTGPMTELEAWQAIAEDRVTVHYQPQFDIRTETMVSVEALVRLLDIDGELIYPDQFIQMAENSGMIAPLGRKVIELACQHFAGWRQQGLKLQHVSINLSAHQLELDPEILDFLDDTLAIHGLEYSDLEFELTERQYLVPDNQGREILMELARRGSRIAIDDFGVGYGSNLYLTELPVSAFKLDVAMTRKLGEDAATTSVIRHLLLLAAELNIDVVAEGVESRLHHDLLAEFDCALGQGYHYAKPMCHLSLVEFIGRRHIG